MTTVPTADDCVDSPACTVFIDFNRGKISGDCGGCTVADVAVAFEQIIQRMQILDDMPDYVRFDGRDVYSSVLISR